jgi:hypothetical protein
MVTSYKHIYKVYVHYFSPCLLFCYGCKLSLAVNYWAIIAAFLNL